MSEIEELIDISIIIPVYNCEKYIKQCVNSVQMQTLKNLEIICVDDGSTDLSVDILKKLSFYDKRIKIFRQKNYGAGQARNLGLEKARGTYIAFLDADDYYMDQRALEYLLKRCTQTGVKACGGIMCHNINGKEKKAANYKQMTQLSQQGVISFLEDPLDYDFTTFIFERSIIKQNEICFSDYTFYEDPPFLVQVLFHAQKYVIVDIDFYCYRICQKQNKFTSQNCEDLLLGLQKNIDFSIEHNIKKLFMKTLLRLEYEYCERILKNICVDKVDSLRVLVEINNMVQNQPGYLKYIIRPLKKILCQINFMNEHYKENLQNEISKCEKIYIFGAGMMAQKFLNYLKNIHMYEKVEALLVTDKREIQDNIETIPVYEIDEIDKTLSGSYIYVVVSGLFIAEIVKELENRKIKNYEILDTEILNDY